MNLVVAAVYNIMLEVGEALNVRKAGMIFGVEAMDYGRRIGLLGAQTDYWEQRREDKSDRLGNSEAHGCSARDEGAMMQLSFAGLDQHWAVVTLHESVERIERCGVLFE
jgi:hypothetical protein